MTGGLQNDLSAWDDHDVKRMGNMVVKDDYFESKETEKQKPSRARASSFDRSNNTKLAM